MIENSIKKTNILNKKETETFLERSISNLNKLGITSLGAYIYSHNDNDKTTSYICGHVMRISTESKNNKLKYTGFIHIHKEAIPEQFYEVLKIAIEGYSKKIVDYEVTILITGFTKFGEKVPDNSSGKLLFGDGVSIDVDSFGLKKPIYQEINKIMASIFDGYKEFKDFIIENNIIAGRSYFYQNKKINLCFLRLSVTDNFKKIEEDDTGNLLKDTINRINPSSIISFGVGLYNEDEKQQYNIENKCYGYKNAKELGIYSAKNYISSNDLETIFINKMLKV
ncbi:MAG: hypothetical protein AABZ74_12600 [Cyanobacteriota bacterium]